MNPSLKNIIAVIAGLVIGSAVNMSIIMMSSSIIPPPEGADLTTAEGLKNSMHLMQPKHFIMPFLAHALGTLAGALLAVKLAASHHLRMALIVGVFFLIGGIANVLMLPSPIWFTVIDLAGAYLPMSFLATRIAGAKNAIISA